MVSTLEEVALHQQNIEKIELLGQLCPKLKILYLQSNLISKIQNLHKLKVRPCIGCVMTAVIMVGELARPFAGRKPQQPTCSGAPACHAGP